MKYKKSIAVLMSFILTLTAVCMTEFTVGADWSYRDHFYYEQIGSYIEFTGCDPSGVSFDIPSEIKGLPVKSIGWWAFCDFPEVESITIPDSVTMIKDEAFRGCIKLKGITIPESVTELGERAFSTCTSFKSIMIPDSVTKLGEWTFAGCTGLEDVTLGNNVTSIVNNMFYNCISLTDITIPKSVTEIGTRAFSYCKSLKSITIPENVAKVGKEAFYECAGLESITFEDPECEIDDSDLTISSTAVIYGYPDSTAQAYAQKYSREFVSLTGKPEINVPDADTTVNIQSENAGNVLETIAVSAGCMMLISAGISMYGLLH